MATKIRLQRHGRKSAPLFHIVVADSRSKRDGKYIERLGSYNPNNDPATVSLNFDSAVKWVGTGAEMALGVLDPQYKKQMNEEEAINLAVKAVRSASLRDSASGDGIDVLIINKNGVKEVSEKILATS